MAAKKLSNEKPHIEDFDEAQLKSLLDEAMDYKNPRDVNDKSETFKQLIKNVKNVEVQDMSVHGLSPSITAISSMTASGGPPLASTFVINSKMSSSTATSSTTHSVDKVIEFSSLLERAKSYHQPQYVDMHGTSTINHHNNIVVANSGLNCTSSSSSQNPQEPLQLSSGYTSVASLTADKSKTCSKPPNHDNLPDQTPIQKPSMMPTAHDSGAVANSKEAKSKLKRVQKTNETTVDVKSIQGFRGTDEIEDLIKYIEDGGGKHQKHSKNGVVTNEHLLSVEEKKKKENKLKKFSSTGRQQQEKSSTAANKIIRDGTLRSMSSNLTSGAKNEIVVIEPLSAVVTETEFHVVTKKRKGKRKSKNEDLSKAVNQTYKHDGNANSINLEVQDMSAHGFSSTIALGGPPLASTSVINPKISSSTATSSAMHNFDKVIEFPSLIERAKSYQQKQYVDRSV